MAADDGQAAVSTRVTDGGVAAVQSDDTPLTVLAGGAIGDEFNTLGERLIPKGCFRVEDHRFDFDSSFVQPDIRTETAELLALIQQQTRAGIKPPLSIFGHADPVGDDEYNKQLSGRRAQAIYAMLVRDVELWEELFTQPFGGDKWGDKQIQTMLRTLGETAGGSQAIKGFQSKNGLGVDGVAGPTTRKALYRKYMDALCGPALLLDKKTDFLGRNRDPKGKGDFQGCSEFNPLLVFSKSEEAIFAKSSNKTQRNNENAPNRRVMVLLFAPGRRVNPAKWPCPRVKEGTAACRKRFFRDGDQRRGSQAERRLFEATQDTMACRFYQAISNNSPCERLIQTFQVRLFDQFSRPLSGAPFQVEIAGRPRSPILFADEEAFALIRDVEVPATGFLRWGIRPEVGEIPTLVFEASVFFDVPDIDEDDGAERRLSNLGFSRASSLSGNVLEFQRARGLPETGKVDDIRDVLLKFHDDLDPEPIDNFQEHPGSDLNEPE